MTQMLYKSPGPHDWPQHGGTFEYIVVQEDGIDQAVLDGWSMTTTEALAAMKLQIGDTVTFINDDTGVITPMTVTEVYEGPTGIDWPPKEDSEGIIEFLDRTEPFFRMELSPRTQTILDRNGIHTVESLRSLSGDDLLAMKGIGKASIEDIREGFERLERHLNGLD